MKASFNEAIIEEIIKPVLPKEWLKDTRFLDQPDRPLRHRRPAGRLRPDRPQDHRRHLRRRLPARWWRVLGQGPVEGRPLGRLCRALRGQEHRGRRHCRPVPDPGGLRDRRGRADEHHGLHRGHRPDPRRQDRRSWCAKHFDLRPKGIIQMLDLLHPIYQKHRQPTATSAASRRRSRAPTAKATRRSRGRRPTRQPRCVQRPG